MQLLGTTHPIVQAPMAGASTIALVAAVSNAGGLGSFGCARDDANVVRSRANEIRNATKKPYNLNFFVHTNPPIPDPTDIEHAMQPLKPYFEEFGVSAPTELQPIFADFDGNIVDALLEISPPVVSFHFGLPNQEVVAALKKKGCVIISTATTVNEARWLEETGADAIVAQGFEAGGHLGHFKSAADASAGGMALIPQIADAVKVPVIAAGGIADGRGIAAAFALGASGVQIGTAFLTTPEAEINSIYLNALLQGNEIGTEMTRSVSGGTARGLRTRFVQELRQYQDETLPFPWHYSLTRPLQAASAAKGSNEMLGLWCGQAVALNRQLPAATLLETLVEETQAALTSLSLK
jgi:nitronate monooxygenase